MFNFFVQENGRKDNCFEIQGADYNHAKNVLRLRVGEKLLVSCNGVNNLCTVKGYTDDCLIAQIEQENFMDTSLPVQIHLYQGLPKSDKMELIIQKAVELGASEITPVEMSRCIVKMDGKKAESKIVRWQAIAESAAKQSKCVKIAKVNPVINYKNLLEEIKGLDLVLLPYENKDGMQATKDALKKIKPNMKVGIIIGPEGGFSCEEVELAEKVGTLTISLGKRILRTETAAITATAMVMLYAETNL